MLDISLWIQHTPKEGNKMEVTRERETEMYSLSLRESIKFCIQILYTANESTAVLKALGT